MASICARPCRRISSPRCLAATAKCGVATRVLCCDMAHEFSCRRDGGRLGLRQYRVAAPRGDRGKGVERRRRRRRGAAAAGEFPVLVIGTRRRRGAAQQLNGADGARRPGRLHAAAATNLACRHRRDRTQVCKSEKLLLQKSPMTRSFAVSRSMSTKPGLVGSPGTCVEIKQ